MKFYSTSIITVFTFFMIFSCDSSDDGPALEDSVSIVITSFQPSKNKVEITWDLKRFNGAIVNDLNVIRYSNDEDAASRQEIIANLPSNETKFVDTDVPYLEDVNYSIVARYFVENQDDIEYFDTQSEEETYEREITKISRIPNHIIQDPVDPDNYHFLIRSANIDLHKYNMSSGKIEANKVFPGGYNHYDKIMTDGNALFVGSKQGVIYKLNRFDYTETDSYSVPVKDELESFSIRSSEIHYNDNEHWKYYNMTDQASGHVNDYFATNFAYSLDLPNDNMLIIRYNYPSYSGALYNISTFNSLDLLHITNFDTNFSSPLDKGILHFKADKSQFVSTIFGRVISTDDLSLVTELKDKTGKDYLYFNYDNNGKLYGAVQNEKLIHVFDDQTYELMDTIETKLYPIFPFISGNGEIQSLGRYSRVGYWRYHDGFNLFSAHLNCAIETF